MLEPAIARALTAGNRHIAITGAGGWLGLASLDLLERAFGADFPQRVSCYGSSSRTLDLGGRRRIEQRPLADLAALDAKHVLLLHYAFLTKDRAEDMSEDAYRSANGAISETVLRALDVIDAEAVFVASSGAAAKAGDPMAGPAMRLYGAMKLDDEDRFAAWAERSRRRVVIGRIFNITGPYINKHQAYAFASFLLDALAGRAIEVRAPRPVIRSYVAIRELLSLILALMLSEECGVCRFDSGGEPLELGDVAQAIARIAGDGQVVRAPVGQADADSYHGDGAAYQRLLDRHGVHATSLADQIAETLGYLRELGLGERPFA